MDHMDRMNTSCPGHEGVSGEINAKYLIFDDFSDLAISAAHRDGFCERMCPNLQVGVYRPNTTRLWDHRRLVMWVIAGRYGVWCHRDGHDGRLGGKFAFGGGLGFDPEFALVSGPIELTEGALTANCCSIVPCSTCLAAEGMLLQYLPDFELTPK